MSSSTSPLIQDYSNSKKISDNNIILNGNGSMPVSSTTGAVITSTTQNKSRKDKTMVKKLETPSISICINSVDEHESKNESNISSCNDKNGKPNVDDLSLDLKELKVDNDKKDGETSNPKANDDIRENSKKRSNQKPLIRSGAVRESSLSPSPPPVNSPNGEVTNSSIATDSNHLTVAYSNCTNGNTNSLPVTKNNSINSDTSSPCLSRG